MKKLLLACTSLALLWGCQNAPEKQATKPKETSGTFPVPQQQIFCLSMMSNLPASIAWPYDKAMGDNAGQYADSIIVNIAPLIDATLQNATDTSGGQNLSLKTWTRVWGPAVITDNNSSLCTGPDEVFSKRAYVPVSSMTIFKDNNNNYVVGVEATNPESKTDWFTLDLNVNSTVLFNTSDVSQGSLTNGTSIGLNQYLLQLKDMNTGTTAMSYLQSQIGTANSVTITGHSLGGALAPVLALYCTQHLDSGKSANKIYCLATAGASPGDMKFIDYFNKQMGSRSVRIWNTLDVVPHAWEPDTMDLIKSIYQHASASIGFDSPFACGGGKTNPSIAFDSMSTPYDIRLVIDHLVKKLKDNKLVYGSICNGGQTFTGTQQPGALYFNTGVPSSPSLFDNLFPNDITFLGQLGNQHVAAYTMYFKIIGIHQYVRARIQANTVKNALPFWNCNKAKCKCAPIHVSAAPTADADAMMDEKAGNLWGLIQKYAWNW